jgi:hypothetical protein
VHLLALLDDCQTVGTTAFLLTLCQADPTDSAPPPQSLRDAALTPEGGASVSLRNP